MNQAAALSLGHLPGSLCAILLCVSTYFLYNFFFHPLARVPGPLSARLGIPWFRTYATITRTYAWKLQSMHLKYGSVVRLGPNFVSTTDPEAVRTLYAYGSPFHKTRFYVAFSELQSSPWTDRQTNESHEAQDDLQAPSRQILASSPILMTSRTRSGGNLSVYILSYLC